MALRLILLACALMGSAATLAAQECRVLDPELQGAYAGACSNGFAEGYGIVQGFAEYRGEFKSGRKHGKGVKIWPNGDRFEGDFVDDRRSGVGRYAWGRGAWAGESYEGSYSNDRRHGFGVYRWPSGDLYAGPWDDDRIAGRPTPMMSARAKFEEEARAAVAKEGTRVCRRMPIGLAHEQWLRGVVVSASADRIGVRIEDGKDLVWQSPLDWMPCF